MNGAYVNSTQKYIVIGGVFLFILMGIVPPWVQTFDAKGTYSEEPLGYFPIITPPKPTRESRWFGVKIDISRLAIQWFVVFVSTGVFVSIARDD